MNNSRPPTPAMLQILVALATGPKHGYGIMLEVEDLTGKSSLGPGTLYRSIAKLLDAGLIQESGSPPNEPDDDERRRYYRLTANGKAIATAEVGRLEKLVKVARRNGLVPDTRGAPG